MNFIFSPGVHELSVAQLLSDQTGRTVVPGELVCITCKKQLFRSHEPEDIPAPDSALNELEFLLFPNQ